MGNRRKDCDAKALRAAFATAFLVVLVVALALAFFCLVEAVTLLFTHGTFSIELPIVATVVSMLFFVALAMVYGGDGR